MQTDNRASAPSKLVAGLPRYAREALLQAVVALALAAAALAGMLFVVPGPDVAIIWPAAGLALAVAFRLGPRYLIGIAVGAFAAHLSKTNAVMPAFAITTGSVVGAALGAGLMRWGGVELGLSRLRDVLCLLAAVTVAGTVTSAVGSGVVYAAGMTQWEGWRALWWICWVADTVGALLLAPVLLTLHRSWHGTPYQRLESLALGAAVVSVSWVVYADTLPEGVAMARSLSYLIFPLLIWAAVRLGVRDVALLLLVHGAIGLYFTSAAHGPFADGALRESLLALHAHLASVGVSMLLLASAMAEQRRTQAALRQRESEYRLLVENQSDLILKLDRDGRILYASPSLSDRLQLRREELLGVPARRLLAAHGATAVNDAWQRVLEPPYTVQLEQPLNTADGERWVAWVAKGVVDNGEVRAVVAVGRDITERRQAEARARQHLQELAHVGRIGAMGELAAGLAHELNQPLCAITSFSQASLRLLPADVDPDLKDAMERIAGNARRAGTIISQMRAFVRKDDQQWQVVDINQLIDEVAALTRTDARHHGVRLDLELQRGLPPVEVAPIQIQQVLVNLVRNAVEAMEDAGSPERHIRICSRLSDDKVEVSVVDSGPGLPPDLLDQVFHPFVTTKIGGMGLGLSISRSIVEAHGGRLTARNRPDGGSEFLFSLATTEQRAEAG